MHYITEQQNHDKHSLRCEALISMSKGLALKWRFTLMHNGLWWIWTRKLGKEPYRGKTNIPCSRREALHSRPIVQYETADFYHSKMAYGEFGRRYRGKNSRAE